MKRCRTCFHVTAGSPTFCPGCGGSYDRRVCPKGHSNPRSAIACGGCGARELSHAQPRRRLASVAGFALSRTLLGTALLAGTIIYAIGFAIAAIRDPAHLLSRMLLGLGLGTAWLLFVHIT